MMGDTCNMFFLNYRSILFSFLVFVVVTKIRIFISLFKPLHDVLYTLNIAVVFGQIFIFV